MISVCIATYNGAPYIRGQIASILTQLSENDEIIISDDHSTDNTIEIIQSIQSPLIHIYTNNGAHGYTPNFENALRMAQGDFIFIADQDDIWMPNKVEVCLHHLKDNALVISDATITDAEGTPTGNSFYALRRPYRSFWGNLFKFGYLGCCIAFRREILRKALPFPADHIKCTHDNWLVMVAYGFFSVRIIDQPLIYYRRHTANTSAGGIVNNTSMLFKIQYRIYLLWQLIKRIA